MTARIAILTRANALARLSRYADSAPYLGLDVTRERILAWLQWNDPNGCHTDALARAEGMEPHTLDSAWDALETMLAD